MPSEAQTVEVEQLEEVALAWPERAKAITITDQETYNGAATVLVEIVAIRKQVQAHHKPIKEATNKAHKTAVAAEKKLLDPLTEAEGYIRKAIGAWDYEQERLRQEEQKRLEAIQRQADEDARLALAQEAEENGAEAETVDEILATPVVMPTAVAKPTFQHASGISTRQNWKAEVVDMKALCRAVASGQASAELVQPNMVALNRMAKAMRTTFNIPGCKAVTESVVGVRNA
jgi:hypothetical protein